MQTLIVRFLKYAILLNCLWFLAWAPLASKSALKSQVLGGFILMLVYALLGRRRREQPLVPLNRTGFYLALFACCLCASAALSLDWYHSQKIIINRYGFYAGAFFLGCFCAGTSKGRSWIPATMAISGLVLGAGGIHDYLRSPGKLYGAWGIDLNLAPFLALYMPFLFAGMLTRTGAQKFLSGAAFVACCPSLLWHGSRAAVFAVVVSCVALAAHNRRKALYIALGSSGAIAASFIVSYWGRLLHVLNPYAWGNRVGLWSSALALFFDYPFLGAGPGMYEKLLYVYAPFGNYSEGIIHLHAHNSFLELLAETGLAGVCFFSAALVSFARAARRGIMRPDNPAGATLLGVLGVVIAGVILALFCTILIVGTQETAVFWFLWGMGAVSLNLKERIA